ncbi:putative cyanohydrin beta-glucosyltransferase [Rosa chinensis]|uniref:Putative cyanohydrin beta-glucosyltransferase n=1 Tax=Rosa chinensis TaxID=74649 RepID=A0A2P6RTB0_ROSCH|nr:putative cyanohydrin beta-glucosyltransferase [Rosa chinensis]
MEIGSDVKRDEVQKLVKEIMEGEKGKTMRKNILEWKKLAKEAIAQHGSSFKNLDILVNQVLLRKREGRAGV